MVKSTTALWGGGNRRVGLGLRGVELESHVADYPQMDQGDLGSRWTFHATFAMLFLDNHPVIMHAFQSHQTVSLSRTLTTGSQPEAQHEEQITHFR